MSIFKANVSAGGVEWQKSAAGNRRKEKKRKISSLTKPRSINYDLAADFILGQNYRGQNY